MPLVVSAKIFAKHANVKKEWLLTLACGHKVKRLCAFALKSTSCAACERKTRINAGGASE